MYTSSFDFTYTITLFSQLFLLRGGCRESLSPVDDEQAVPRMHISASAIFQRIQNKERNVIEILNMIMG